MRSHVRLAPKPRLRSRTTLAATIATAVLAAFPTLAQAAAIPGETMTLKPASSGEVFADSAANGGKTLKIHSKAVANRSIRTTDRATRLVVRARGKRCSGVAPRITVTVDGVRRMKASVTSNRYAKYSVGLKLGKGAHRLKVIYGNDLATGNCDRNVSVDTVTLVGTGSKSPAASAPAPASVSKATAPGPTTTAPAPATSAGVPSPSSATTVAPGTLVLNDADAAARVRRSTFEPRLRNATANQTVPTALQLQAFRLSGVKWGSGEDLRQKITGNFKGTTDEIIQWAAAKWGLPVDVVRAQAVVETYWHNEYVGDQGHSFGLMQIKDFVAPFTHPMSATSTAFNLDYYAASIRYYYDGHSDWMNNQPGRVGTYAGGDLWGSIGAWFSGNWHDEGSEDYIAKVKNALADRTWAQPGF